MVIRLPIRLVFSLVFSARVVVAMQLKKYLN